MAQGSKKKYTSKQKRKAHDIEKGYKKRRVSGKEAERRAWATVNKSDKGGRKKGGGGGEVNQVPAMGEEKVVEGRPTQSTRRSNAGLCRRIVCNGDQITRKRSGKFHFDLVRFFRAALAPFLPRPCESFSADAQSFSFAVQWLPF